LDGLALNYTIITICTIAVIFALYVAIINIVNRYYYAVNRLFSLIAILTAGMVSCLIIPYFMPDIDIVQLTRWYFGLIIIINQGFFHYTQIFPRWEKKSPLWMIIITAIPGFITFILCVATDTIIMQSSFIEDHINFSYGVLVEVYIVVFIFYILGTFFTLFYKVKRLENTSFRYQLFYIFMGNHFGALIILITFIILPYAFKIYYFHSSGIASAALILLLINNYAISDERYLDVKEFYFKIVFYCIVFAMTVIPSYFILVYSYRFFLRGGQIPAVAVAFINGIYLFVFTRFIQPYLEKSFKREYVRMETRFNTFIQALSQAEEFEGDPAYWDKFFSTTIDSLENLFNVSSASLLMYNESEKAFILSRNIGEQTKIKRVVSTDSIVQLCEMVKTTIHQSLFYTDDTVKAFDDVLKLVKSNSIEVILPIFDANGKLVAILFIGPHKKGRPYTYNEIQFMELYRVKFGNALVNSLQIEDVKTKQIGEHDKLLVNVIKTSLQPRQIPFIDHIRISSILMNNSNLGGEFCHARVLRKNLLGFFIADCSYSGVDAAVLAMELYGAFESCSPVYDAPEKIMQLLNWVVCTSRFNDRYATALCFTFNSDDLSLKYINAAFNPLILYEIHSDSFLELDTKGIPIGIERDFIYESKEYRAHGPCIGCIYSNGIADAVNAQGQPYSIGRIKDLIRLHNSETPALIIRRISSDLNDFISNTVLKEDISIVIFRIE